MENMTDNSNEQSTNISLEAEEKDNNGENIVVEEKISSEKKEIKEENRDFNVEIDDEIKDFVNLSFVDAIKKEVKSGKIDVETAKKMIEDRLEYAKEMKFNLESKLDAESAQWVETLKEDPEIGRENFNASLEIARRGVKEFASKELIDFLNVSRLGNHPEFVKLFYRIGKKLQDDQLITAKTQVAESKKSLAEILYS